jgi:hypothetical protein
VQVSTSNTFASLALSRGTSTLNTSWSASPGSYYWRVSAYSGSLQGPWSSVWSFTIPVPPPPPPVVTLQSPANSSTASSPVTFQWLPVSGATYYQVQASTTSSFSVLSYYSGAAGTSNTWSNVPPGTYYWRVTYYIGTTQGPWSAVWSFTIPVTPPSAPTLLTPSNGSTQSSSVAFSWQPVSEATYYQIEVSQTSGFTTLVLDNGTTSTSVTASGGLPGTYYWRVSAYNGLLQGPWSAIWSFVIPQPPLNQVILTAPANGSTIAGPTLKWQGLIHAISYGVQVATDPGFSNVVINEVDTGTSRPWISAPPGTYYWRVYARGVAAYGPWSKIWSFTVPGTPLLPPVLTAPSNGATVPNTITLQWSPAATATSYYVHVAKDAAFTEMVLAQTTTETQLVLPTQTVGTTLYWCVGSFAGTEFSGFSAPWSFTVGAMPPLAAPVLVSPTDGATGVTAPWTLQWEAVTGATGYYVQVASDAGFANKVFIGTTPDLEQVITGLTTGCTVYWRVMATAAGNYGPWSDVWSFTAQ